LNIACLIERSPLLINDISGLFLSGWLINTCINYVNPSYNPAAWKAYLFIVALTTLGALVNTYLSRVLPKLEGIALILTLTGFGSIVIVLWVLGSDTQLSASEVFGTFENNGKIQSRGSAASFPCNTTMLTTRRQGGWPTLGLGMMAGQITMVWTLTGTASSSYPMTWLIGL